MSIRIIITGGTFDKRYDELTGQLTLDQTHLPQIIRQVHCTIPVELEINQLIDSLEMREACRRKILASCRECAQERIIVTHGTDTMAETAAVLGQAALPKTIVLTGAMRPFSFGESDALFNLGGAMIAVQNLPHGVYLVMNGRVFPWDNVRKNKNKGVFELMRELL